MKKFLKSSLAIFLAITITFSSAYVGLGELDFGALFEIKAEAANSGTCGDNLTWKFDSNGTLTISGTGEMMDYLGNSFSTIPPWYTNYINDKVTKIVINSGVTGIGVNAFNGCHNVTSVTIPDSVTSIDDYAFAYCSSLTTISIPKSVANIGNGVFGKCSKLVAINVDDENSVYSSIDGVLLNKSKTHLYQYPDGKTNTEYTIPDSVKVIKSGAFFNCDDIKSITLSDSVIRVYDYAFVDCSKLTSIFVTEGNLKFLSVDGVLFSKDKANLYAYPAGKTNTAYEIPDDVKKIANGAFSYCTNLASISIPDSVTTIGAETFYSCSNLASISIPDSVTTIGENTFYSCSNLTSVTIPGSVTIMGKDAFKECNRLKHIYISDLTAWCNINFENTYANPLCYGGNLYINGVLADEIVVPNGITTIKDFAFYNCDSILSITITDSVITVGQDAFKECSNLKNIYISDLTAWCNINFRNAYANPLYCGENLYINGALADDIVVPDGVTAIKYFAFYDYENLLSITIPDSVTTIEKSAFYDCSKLSTVDMGEGVTDIGDYAFGNCSALTTLTIPDSVTRIGYSSFINCSELVTIYMGKGVKYIENKAFYDCENISYVFYTGTLEEWFDISIGKDNSCLYGYIYPECGKTQLLKLSNVTSGVKITWKAVEYSSKSYRVYRKTKGGEWKYLDSTENTYFIDKTAKSGTTYYYAVKVRNEAGNTDYSNSLSIKYLSVPKKAKVSNTSSGVKMTWSKVTGASGYIVYRKTKSGDWKEIGKTTKLYYTDKKAKSGTSYYYSVRAYSGSVKSYYDKEGLSLRRLLTPKISSATSKNEGILLKWNKITGASGYYVYRKASSGEWKRIATVKGNTKIKYLDESPRKGATYQYRVKAYYSKSTSANSNTYKIKCKY